MRAGSDNRICVCLSTLRGLRVVGLGLRFEGVGFRAYGGGWMVGGRVFGVWGLGFRVKGLQFGVNSFVHFVLNNPNAYCRVCR